MSRLRTTLGFTCLLATSAVAFASACGSDDDGASPTDAGADVTHVTVANDAAVTSGFTDGQIYQILIVFNQGEVAEADIANGAASNPSLRVLAGGLDETYSVMAARLVQFAKVVNMALEPSDNATSLAAATTADEAMYGGLAGAGFDSAFVSVQIASQTTMLNLIDSQLLPSVTDPNLAGLVAVERQQVAGNLAATQALSALVDADGGVAPADAGTDASVDATVTDAAADAADAADAAIDDADADAGDASSDADSADDADAADASDAADGD